MKCLHFRSTLTCPISSIDSVLSRIIIDKLFSFDRQITESNEEDEFCSYDLVVRIGGVAYPVRIQETEYGVKAIIDEREIQLETDWEVGETMMTANVNGEDISIHVSGT